MKDEVALSAPSQFLFELKAYQNQQKADRKEWYGESALRDAGTDLARLRQAYLVFEPDTALEKRAAQRISKTCRTTKQWIANLAVAKAHSFLLNKTVAELKNKTLTSYDWQELVRVSRHGSPGERYIVAHEEAKELYKLGAEFLLSQRPHKYYDWKAVFLLALAAGCAEMALDAFRMLEASAQGCEATLQNFAFYKSEANKSVAARVEREG